MFSISLTYFILFIFKVLFLLSLFYMKLFSLIQRFTKRYDIAAIYNNVRN